MGRADWIRAGEQFLREAGPDAIRVDRLARQLGLTKGAFHHHFSGAGEYRQALLEHCVSANSAALAAVAEDLAGLQPRAAIAALTRAPGPDLALDRALRAWAVADTGARDAVDRMDADRLTLLEELWGRVVADPELARSAALIPHLVTIAASVSSLDEDDLKRVYALLARLAPSVPE